MKHNRNRTDDSISDYIANPRIELIGTHQCIIDGLKGITQYSTDKIKINLGKNSVSVLGDELYINSFSYQGAIIEGTIISVEFESND